MQRYLMRKRTHTYRYIDLIGKNKTNTMTMAAVSERPANSTTLCTLGLVMLFSHAFLLYQF